MSDIRDVAKLSGVATGTVSKFLKNDRSVKPQNRVKIENAIKALKYVPSPIAQSMRTKKTSMIAVLAPYITNPFFAEVFNSIRINSLKAGYATILYTTDDDLQTFKKYIKNLSLKHIDGIILVFLDDNDIFQELIENIYNLPSVTISWDKNNPNPASIIVDVHKGMYDLTKHLININRKNFAYLSGPIKSKISQDKYNGFLTALLEHQILFNQKNFIEGTYNISSGYKCTQQLIKNIDNIDAIVCVNDIIAVGCLKSLIQNKIKVPDKVAVTGFDDIPISLACTPSLTTVSLPIKEIGMYSTEMLINIINGHSQNKVKRIISTKVTIRDSTIYKSLPS